MTRIGRELRELAHGREGHATRVVDGWVGEGRRRGWVVGTIEAFERRLEKMENGGVGRHFCAVGGHRRGHGPGFAFTIGSGWNDGGVRSTVAGHTSFSPVREVDQSVRAGLHCV